MAFCLNKKKYIYFASRSRIGGKTLTYCSKLWWYRASKSCLKLYKANTKSLLHCMDRLHLPTTIAPLLLISSKKLSRIFAQHKLESNNDELKNKKKSISHLSLLYVRFYTLRSSNKNDLRSLNVSFLYQVVHLEISVETMFVFTKYPLLHYINFYISGLAFKDFWSTLFCQK